MIGISQDGLRAALIFFPDGTRRQLDIFNTKPRFVHYTSAEAAIKIFRSNSVWLRKTIVMNDYSEAHHGHQLLLTSYNGPVGAKLKDNLEKAFPGISAKVEQLFNQWSRLYLTDTFVTCLSQHTESEDIHGRLSMWRAYGVPNGVALVVRSEPFVAVTDALHAYSFPVAYGEQPEVDDLLTRVSDAVAVSTEFLQSLGQSVVERYMHELFRYMVVGTKHPGFAEELEWRVIYNPGRDTKKRLKHSIEIIGGRPQPVYSLPLVDIPSENLVGISIPDLIDRVIVGPTLAPLATYESLVTVLDQAGVKDAASKVFISRIPLRT